MNEKLKVIYLAAALLASRSSGLYDFPARVGEAIKLYAEVEKQLGHQEEGTKQ